VAFSWQVVLELNAAPERHVQVVEARLDDSGAPRGDFEKLGGHLEDCNSAFGFRRFEVASFWAADSLHPKKFTEGAKVEFGQLLETVSHQLKVATGESL